MILLLLRKSLISLYQPSNFILSPLNHLGSRTILFDITAYPLFVSAGVPNISVSICSFVLSKISSSVIYKDSNCSNSASMLFILLELVLVSLCSLYYMYFTQKVTLFSFIHGFYLLHLSYKVSSSMLYQML